MLRSVGKNLKITELLVFLPMALHQEDSQQKAKSIVQLIILSRVTEHSWVGAVCSHSFDSQNAVLRSATVSRNTISGKPRLSEIWGYKR